MMAPFTEIPEGMSPATLEMLDRAFSATWHELQLARWRRGFERRR